MFHYLLQIVVFQLLFLIFYNLIQKKETFFTLNRIYLIATPLISFILPFVKIKNLNNSKTSIYFTRLEKVANNSYQNLEKVNTTVKELDAINWLLIIYFIGVVISLLIFIYNLYKLYAFKKSSFKNCINGHKVFIIPKSNQAFSFFNTIYLGEKLSHEEKKQIIPHEIIHVKELHSFDQILFEVLKIGLWWNPLIYLYQNKISELHEFVADAKSTNTLNKKYYINQLLNTAFNTNKLTFTNHFFNQSLIKKRIIMLQKSKSKNVYKLKYLLLLPIIIGIITYTSCGLDTNESKTKIENTETTENVFRSSYKENKNLKLIEESTYACSNKNSLFSDDMHNYLKLTTPEGTEIIADLISNETNKSIRTIHLLENSYTYLRNIPEGVYSLTLQYGTGYTEKNIDGTCTPSFDNLIEIEKLDYIIDFTIVKTEKGIDMPSYELNVDGAL